MIEAAPAPVEVADSFNIAASLLVTVTCVATDGAGFRITVSDICRNLPIVNPPERMIFVPVTVAVTDAGV